MIEYVIISCNEMRLSYFNHYWTDMDDYTTQNLDSEHIIEIRS